MKMTDLPGPRGLPVLGNLLQTRTGSLHLIAERWSRTYGEAFRFRIGPREILALATAFDIESVTTPDGREAQEHLAFTMHPVGLRLKLREKERARAPLARSA